MELIKLVRITTTSGKTYVVDELTIPDSFVDFPLIEMETYNSYWPGNEHILSKTGKTIGLVTQHIVSLSYEEKSTIIMSKYEIDKIENDYCKRCKHYSKSIDLCLNMYKPLSPIGIYKGDCSNFRTRFWERLMNKIWL